MYKEDHHINEFHNFSILEELLGGQFTQYSKLVYININNVIAKGFIKCVKHSNGIISFNADLTPNKDLDIPISSSKIDTIQFLYVFEGTAEYRINNSNKRHLVNELQTAVILNKSSSETILRLRKNTRTIFNIISLRKKVYTSLFNKNDDEFSMKALKFINDLNKSDKTIIPGDYDVKIAEHFKSYFKQINDDKNMSFLSAEGSIYHLLSNHFRLALKCNDNYDSYAQLNYTELKKISDLGDVIKATPETQYSINMLSRESGLSPAKLQEGFKTLYNRTVSDFIRHVRLQKAEYLMNSTDFNISEIVYSIGFTSRSYFCKIFKKEYGCSPKQYKKKVSKNHYSLSL
ncbi:AraC family transcriptional regulator [uncultured Winogradskyella sp.]|uniref:helix-turn-helix domain-containing protein n=1 Tax=uncultured Winogradskyella sp. TaxID=395353 RepID=UPI0026283D9F|nr:AraC family transcriptional regulator [uncultured Winogradskyella sp.]